MSFPDYEGKNIGFAKVMAEVPVSDGTLAYEIMNFTANEEGFLENKFKILPLIPNEWNTSGKDKDITTQPEELQEVLGMKYLNMDGEAPELIFLTRTGVFRYLPSNRTGSIPYGSIETDTTSSNGLVEQFYYTGDNDKKSIKPQKTPLFPPQTQVIGNRLYFTFCDGGGSYVWDGIKVREFGYSTKPSSPYVMGPSSNDEGETANDGWTNGGGFSDTGRIGTLNYSLQFGTDEGPVTTGGLEAGLWYYGIIFENEDGAYSVTSGKSNRVTIQFSIADLSDRNDHGIAYLRRRFWLCDIPKGPAGTVARVLVRTMNLSSLPSGEVGNLRFLHRIPNNSALQYMDDIPDAELGATWEHRRSIPVGFYFMKFFNGSMFLMRTDRYSSRVWWSEQGVTTGSIPESFMHSHWRDVFPETGPITGSFPASIGSQQALIIFKESSVHYIGGSYAQPGTEGWTFSTISTVAGCAGPNLCQSSPDGQLIWYGNGTFWSLSQGKDGIGVQDIGQAIRNRLSKVNSEYERFGVSWINKDTKEIVFCLPYLNSTKPDLQFVWDYLNGGWRLRKDLTINAVESVSDKTLLAGSWKGRVGTKGDLLDEENASLYATNTVWVYQRGYPNYIPGSDLISTYTTGWMGFSDFGPEFHASQRLADSVFTMEERSSRIATVKTYADWNFDDAISNDLEISLVHPEQNNINVFNGSSVVKDSETENTVYGSYASDKSLYRKRRTYTHRLPVDVPSCNVFSLSVTSSCINEPMSLISIDAYGPKTSAPTSRSPALYEK